ncbi:hypothetical protein DAEQUDRAFT_725646 [Daedalea quercina L-15889]|uniref:DH domain-containing protein n=1 Tax=Daedalea quercina L-15889 TaxID=1314783 RepID=A0A165R665_9APHY|nr:hypothetical protein DAEQUDRAFT_725646 [Daedalea quercina L-15889]
MFPSSSASRSAKKNRSKSRSHSRARAATLAGLSGTRNSSSPSRARPVPSTSSLASAATVTAPTYTTRGRHPVQTALLDEGDKKRRMSLPPNLSQLDSDGSARGTAASSPVRGAGRVVASPLRAVRSGMSMRRQGSKKLFHLGDTEGSDGERGETEEGASVPARLIRRLSRRSSKSSGSREMLWADMAPRTALDLERESIGVTSSLPRAPPPSPQASLKTTESGGWEEEKEKEAAKTVMSEAEVERLRAATRKYHALLELLATEAGYLMDLRALVKVYLEQLPTLSTASPASSTSPTLSIPSLGLSRSIPSSRSSFLHPHPSPSTSASSHLSAADDASHGIVSEKEKKREKSKERLKDKERHKDKHKAKSSEKENTKGRDGRHGHKGKEKQTDGMVHDVQKVGEKEESAHGHEGSGPAHPRSQTQHTRKHTQLPTRRPILAEKEVAAICRNAQELLDFHDNFVGHLRDAMVGFGLARAFEMGERKEEVAMKLDGSEAAALPTIDQAVAIVAEKFVSEVSSCI